MSEKKVLEYDIVILGGGPAGISAGIYAARGAAKTAIIDTSMLGGQPSNYLELENYPGFGKIGGFDMMEKFEQHVDMFDIDKYPMQEIINIDLNSGVKSVETADYLFNAKAVIIATGAQSKKLGIPGEKEFFGRGVSYCAVCDGAFYKDKTVAVIGGGNAAVEEGAYLTKFAKKVYIIHRRDSLRADKIAQERAFKNEKVEFVYDTIPLEITGKETVETLVVKNVKTGEISKINVDGVFPYIGFAPNVDYINARLQQDTAGFIVTDEAMRTSIEGVFAAGDVRTTPLRQVITAAADGAVAGCYALKYIDENVSQPLTTGASEAI